MFLNVHIEPFDRVFFFFFLILVKKFEFRLLFEEIMNFIIGLFREYLFELDIESLLVHIRTILS